MISTAHSSTKNRYGRLARPFRSAKVQTAASLAEICGVTTIISVTASNRGRAQFVWST